ncbi:MotA/TolQ/ExbB proton channel family protein [Cupriavidus sp. AU9028]|uniref:MotA/TolQ/ExbB proton channel family protein n=1 Tax=Cupriavidus sp. AU9028 TaxID=2871157 RepID=UPI001C9812D8|nr:MotA/TolQ/ExbB proton channel family protein [Cupriavidus sp. AU9028]
MLSIIEAAGWPIWPLLAASIIALALIVERLLTLRRSRVLPAGVYEEAIAAVRQRRATPDAIDSLHRGSPLGKVLATAIRQAMRHSGGGAAPARAAAREAVEDTGRAVAHELERYLNALGTIASAAPLLGLLGTVIGMIEIFGSQGGTGANPEQLAHGISVALYNTAFGLIVAIPALIFWRYFRRRVDDYVTELEARAAAFLDAILGHPAQS